MSKKTILAPTQPAIHVDSLNLSGQGVARTTEHKVIFIEGALPQETVTYQLTRNKPTWAQANVVEIKIASTVRTTPLCPHFGVCGGCALQHLEASAQVAIKARALEDSLWHLGKVIAERLLPPLHGPYWGYRHKARLSVRFVEKKQQLLIGFHEKGSGFVAQMDQCLVLHPRVANRLPALKQLIAELSIMRAIPQIEIAVTQDATAFALRTMEPLTQNDHLLLAAFAKDHSSADEQVQIWQQSAGSETLHALYPKDAQLYYDLPTYGIRFSFRPNDFTQVNHTINARLIDVVIGALQLKAADHVLDLFCGLGNFTLAIASQVTFVLGIEGAPELVNRAHQNAQANQLANKVNFVERNLFAIDASSLVEYATYRKVLIDPPRDGAHALCLAWADLPVRFRPHLIVYVSCNPATLARDAAILVHQCGYRMTVAGTINMFPHTAHVESIAVFQLTADHLPFNEPPAD